MYPSGEILRLLGEGHYTEAVAIADDAERRPLVPGETIHVDQFGRARAGLAAARTLLADPAAAEILAIARSWADRVLAEEVPPAYRDTPQMRAQVWRAVQVLLGCDFGRRQAAIGPRAARSIARRDDWAWDTAARLSLATGPLSDATRRSGAVTVDLSFPDGCHGCGTRDRPCQHRYVAVLPPDVADGRLVPATSVETDRAMWLRAGASTPLPAPPRALWMARFHSARHVARPDMHTWDPTLEEAATWGRRSAAGSVVGVVGLLSLVGWLFGSVLVGLLMMAPLLAAMLLRYAGILTRYPRATNLVLLCALPPVLGALTGPVLGGTAVGGALTGGLVTLIGVLCLTYWPVSAALARRRT